ACVVGARALWYFHSFPTRRSSDLAGLAWMIPRVLDAALEDPAVAAAKFLGVPLLLGAPLALSWPRMGFVVRGVFVTELIATAFRSEEHTSELQSRENLVCRLLLEK